MTSSTTSRTTEMRDFPDSAPPTERPPPPSYWELAYPQRLDWTWTGEERREMTGYEYEMDGR